MNQRINTPSLYMKIAELISQRSTCLKRKVGAIIIRNGRIIATGYNGSPKGMKHCIDTRKCYRDLSKSGDNLSSCIALHAEQNAILQLTSSSVEMRESDDTWLYCNTFPCSTCLKMIINAGIKNIVFENNYDDGFNQIIAKKSPINFFKYKDKLLNRLILGNYE